MEERRAHQLIRLLVTPPSPHTLLKDAVMTPLLAPLTLVSLLATHTPHLDLAADSARPTPPRTLLLDFLASSARTRVVSIHPIVVVLNFGDDPRGASRTRVAPSRLGLRRIRRSVPGPSWSSSSTAHARARGRGRPGECSGIRVVVRVRMRGGVLSHLRGANLMVWIRVMVGRVGHGSAVQAWCVQVGWILRGRGRGSATMPSTALVDEN